MKNKLIREADVMREICRYLDERSYFFWRSNNLPVFGRAMPKYSVKGMADICGIWEGVFFAIEVKRPFLRDREPNGRRVRGGKLSHSQAAFGFSIVLNGGEYCTAYSLEDVQKFLTGIAIKIDKPILTRHLH